jgi:hypothetical protein
MIARLTETFVHGVDLIEAEARLARSHLARFALGIAGLVLCTVVAVAGVIALLTGAAWLLAQAVGVPGALMILGVPAAAGAAYGAVRIYRSLA